MRLVGQLGSACELAREQISLHLDGELSELEQVALNGHLAACGRCRAYGASVADVTANLRSAPFEQPEFPVVLPHRPRVRIPLRAAQMGAAAAVVAIVAFTGAGLTTGGEGSLSLTANNRADAREPLLKPTRGATGSIAFRIERRTMPRPIRGRIGPI
jgi:predicted anti-sigma-YlaC factor YlaD